MPASSESASEKITLTHTHPHTHTHTHPPNNKKEKEKTVWDKKNKIIYWEHLPHNCDLARAKEQKPLTWLIHKGRKVF